MKRLVRFAAKFYPRAWRERYGVEFEALLNDTGADARVLWNVLAAAIRMQLQQRRKMAWAALFAVSALAAVTWWVAQGPFVTPGSNQVFRMDSNVGGMVGFVASLIVLPAAITGFLALLVCTNDRNLGGGAGRLAKACAWMVLPYLAALMLVSLLTPRTIVSVGDGYCWDLWCVGVQHVDISPQGRNILYTAEIRIFSDANRVPNWRGKGFLFAIDEQGRRFPVFQDSSTAAPLDGTVYPNKPVKTTLSFLAPSNSRRLYVTAHHVAMPWAYLYFGSDLNPLHRRTLLRVL